MTLFLKILRKIGRDQLRWNSSTRCSPWSLIKHVLASQFFSARFSLIPTECGKCYSDPAKGQHSGEPCAQDVLMIPLRLWLEPRVRFSCFGYGSINHPGVVERPLEELSSMYICEISWGSRIYTVDLLTMDMLNRKQCYRVKCQSLPLES